MRDIQQRSSSRLFLREAILSSSGISRDIHSLMLPIKHIISSANHGVAHPPMCSERWFWGTCHGVWHAWSLTMCVSIQSNFLCWLIFGVHFHPCVTAVTNKRFWSLCQKYRWQVTVLQANSFSLIQWGWCGTSHSLKKHQNNYGPSWHLVHWQRHHSQAQVLSGCCKYRQSSVMCREMIVRCRKGVSLKSAQVHQFRTPNE